MRLSSVSRPRSRCPNWRSRFWSWKHSHLVIAAALCGVIACFWVLDPVQTCFLLALALVLPPLWRSADRQEKKQRLEKKAREAMRELHRPVSERGRRAQYVPRSRSIFDASAD